MRRISLNISKKERVTNARKGAETCKRLQVNAFFNPLLRLKSCSKGGKVQGRNNAKSGHLKKINQQYWNDVREGKIVPIKRMWVYSDTLKVSKQIPVNSIIPKGFIKGRKLFKK
jgi:hypothetical protein